MRPEAEGVVFFLFHVDPVGDEVGVKDIAFEQEGMIGLERSIAPRSESGTLAICASSSGGSS